MNRNIDKRVLI